jgi:hypothetical protein
LSASRVRVELRRKGRCARGAVFAEAQLGVRGGPRRAFVAVFHPPAELLENRELKL